MTLRLPSLCRACRRYEDDEGRCTSFPGGIPDDILSRAADHRASRSGEPPFELDPARRAVFDRWLRFNAAREVAGELLSVS